MGLAWVRGRWRRNRAAAIWNAYVKKCTEYAKISKKFRYDCRKHAQPEKFNSVICSKYAGKMHQMCTYM
jgi:hypothetical protein